MTFETTEAFAKELDKQDPLQSFKERFYIPDKTIYMDGNSLGLLSKDSEEALLRVISEWKKLAIRGWLEAEKPWYYYSENLGAQAASLVGAQPDEVVVTGTTTMNIHSLVSSFYHPQPGKSKILADELNFPTDLYALRSQIKLKGFDPKSELVLAPSSDGLNLDEKKIVELMTDDVALVFLPSVLYRSGQLLDMEFLTAEAHKRNIPIGFDCSHSVGAVPHYFNEWAVDFALWCSYKYLSSGPGASAFLYVNKKHFHLEPGLAGWFGNNKETQFNMALEFEPADTAGRWQISSPGIIGAAGIEGSLKIIHEASIEAIRKKSLKITSYLMFLIDELLTDEPYCFSIGTLREDKRRGGHVALIHPTEAYRIAEALRANGVVPDFRPENIIRIAPSPLYNSYHDVWRVIQIIKGIIDNKEYATVPKNRKAIS